MQPLMRVVETLPGMLSDVPNAIPFEERRIPIFSAPFCPP